ncbi:MAG: hypothetical protein RBR77_04195 [Thauera sp.]|jgi:hypothetical protein|nr:hypothetical protein [Thauera sp.]
MTIRLSTGLRNALAFEYGLARMMRGGHIQIYGGADQPISADEAPTGTLRAIVSTDGLPVPSTAGGLQFTLQSPGTLLDTGDWKIVGLSTGDLRWWRFVWAADDFGEISTYYPRIDGAASDGLTKLPSTIVASEIIPISFRLLIPSQ